MTIWYIIPTISPGEETDSYVGQYGVGKLRDSWSDVTWTNGDSYYQAYGTVHAGAFTITGPTAPITVGAFGLAGGARPKVLANGGAYAIRIGAASDVTVQDMEGSGGSTADIGRDTNASPRCTIRRCLSRDSITNAAIIAFGDDTVIEDNEIYSAGNDAISFEGDRVRVAHNQIVGFSLATETGDGISASDAVVSTYDPSVVRNLVVASKNVKQCVIFNATSGNSGRGELSHNVLRFVPASVYGAAPGQCVYIDFPGMRVVGNEIVDGLFGLYTEASGIIVMGNLFRATAPQALAGVYIGGADNQILTNTFVNTADVAAARSDQVAIRHADAGSAHTGVVIRDNAVDNWRYGISRRTANSIESHNVVNASASFRAFVDHDYAGVSAGTGSSAADPLLDTSYRLTALSPCRGAGIYIPGAKHYGGVPMNAGAPDIGAHRFFEARAVAESRTVRESVTIGSDRRISLGRAV